MLDYKAVVIGRIGVINKAILGALRDYHVDGMEAVPLLGLPPKVIYRVTEHGRSTLTTDPVEVRHLTRGHDEAEVEIIPVIA